MAALKLTACMKVVAKMGEMDQEALLERLDRYTADGVPKDRAQVMAAADSLAELQAERREFMAMLRQQHPDLFVVSNAIPEDQDVNPDQPDVKREQDRVRYEVKRDDDDEGTFVFAKDPSRKDETGSLLTIGHLHVPDEAVDGSGDFKIGDIYVHGKMRRQGIATEMLRRMEEELGGKAVGAASVFSPDGEAFFGGYSRGGIKRSAGRSEQEIDAAKADGWKIMDNDLPSREAAERIIKLRTNGNSVVKPMAAWQDAEVRVVESDNPGLWAIEARRPDAKRSAARDVTETPEFKAWSEGLPVHDSFDGRSSDRGIYKLFHMTTADFSEFKPGGLKPTDSGPAIWLSADPAATSAAFRVGNAERGFRAGARTMPVYAKVKNPLVIDDAGMLDYARNSFADGSREFPQLISKRTADALKEDGYDSIIFDGPGVGWKGASAEVIVLDGKQIKSAIGNSGAFDPATADITRSRKRQPSEVFGREIAPAAIRAYKSLSAGAKSIVDGWNVNWSMGQGRLRNSKDFDEVVKAYEPVREKLRQVYGSTVPAFRGEKQDGTESSDDRFMFSWTPMRDIAAGFAVNRRYGMPAEIPQSKVDEQIEAYRKTGIARLNGYKFVRKDPGDYEPDGPDYYYIYQGGEMITDGDDIARALQQEKDERDEWISELREGGKLYAGNIPVDSVAFIPVGANLRQPEFVAEYNPRKDAVGEIRLSTKRNELGFHSALERGIEGMQTKSAIAGAWKAQIKGLVNKGAVKQDEVTWSGIEDFLDLQEGKITKEQITDYLSANGVQVEEVVLGYEPPLVESYYIVDHNDGTYDVRSRSGGDEVRNLRSRAEAQNWIDEKQDDEAEAGDSRQSETKYSQYTLPGGENYREVLLTLPEKATEWGVYDGSKLVSKHNSRSEARDAANAAGLEYDSIRSTPYTSDHWDQKNVIAHIRVNDRTDADGSKVLFVEELQSDWGQDGKKKGFAKKGSGPSLPEGWTARKNDAGTWRVLDQNGDLQAWGDTEEQALSNALGARVELQSDGILSAPFVTKTDGWLNLALKRIVTMAVDGGYDKVAFVNGEQSADRYDLSKHVQSLGYEPKTGRLQAFDDRRNTVIDKTGVQPDQLEDYIGKEVAQRLLATEPMMGKHLLDGEQLKVGGEGMKAFYDKIVPNAVKALLKKTGGGQMEVVGINGESPNKSTDRMGFDTSEIQVKRDPNGNWYIERGDQFVRSGDGRYWNGDSWSTDEGETRMFRSEASAKASISGMQQPGFTITDAMREKVATEGLPLFSRKRDVTETPEFKRWFGDSKVVDAEGKPLVVYHGTGGDFTVFDNNVPGNRSVGHYFTVDPGYASMYARSEDFGLWSKRAPLRAKLMPVYLSAQNPKILSRKEWMAIEHGRSPNMDVLNIFNSGHDSILVNDFHDTPGKDMWVVRRSSQIKSAIGNNGDFDPANPDIRRSAGRTSTGAAWDSPSASKFDDLVYKFQDKNIETKRVVEAIKEASGAIADDLNVYLQEELYHGRAAKRTEDFVNMELNPLVEQLAKDGLKLEDLEEFLHARHAPEANDVIARRNPGVAGLQDGGSGMKTADAMNYMATLPADLKQKLEAAAAKVDAIIGKTRQLYVDYELESQDTVDGWGRVFQHYIPLQREDKDGKPGLGQGFSVKGKETKGRTGSTRKVVDILANIAMQRERAIVRGEKNRVSQALVGLAEANPNDGFWKVDVVPTEKVYNPDTGLVEDRHDPMYKSRENAVIAKIKGADGKVKEHAVLFDEGDERAMRMAAALKNLDATKLEGLLGVSAQITRYFAAVNTQYNPVFGVVNLVRDVQGAILNLSSTPIAGDERKVARDTASALRGIYSDARAARKGKNPNSAWSKLWDEFQEVGGQTGYRDLFKNSAERAEAIQKTLNPDAWADSKLGKIFTANGALKVPMAQAKRGAGWIFDLLSDYNLAMENGVRLAAYKAGLEKGLSKEQAASVAKNLTVNFNRKGQTSQQAGALYAFFNASMQGTARIAQTLFEMEPGKPKTIRLSPMGKKVVYGGIMLGSIQAMALAAAGFNDEDPPQFARERGLIIPLMNGKYITIPMPLGFHVIPNIGRITTEFVLSGFRDPHERALQLVSLFADTFNPIGNAGMSMQTLAPTALDPLVALTENRDWTGKPIARESSNPAVPGHALSRDTATSIAKLLSEAINTASGGNKYTAGVFSPTPDQIDYLIGQVTGGVGRELSKVEQSALAVGRGEDLPTYKIPLVGRFVGDSKQQASEGTAFYANTDRINRLETEIKGLQKDGKYAEAAELRRSNSDAYLIAMANQAERQIQRLRSEKRELVKSGAPREKVREVEERITAVMARLNRAAERLREKQEN